VAPRAGAVAHRAGAVAGGVPALVEAVDLVADLACVGSKDVQKAAKRTLFDLKAAGVDVPEPAPSAAAEPEPERADHELPIHRVLVGEEQDGNPGFVSLARLRPNGRLKVLVLTMDLWGGGLLAAGYRSDTSKTAFERTLERTPETMTVRDVDLDEARRCVARGLAVTKAVGAKIPLDYQLGKSLLGPMDEEIAAAGVPFRCEGCGAELGEDTIRQVRDSMVYRHVKVEKRCDACRDAGEK